MLVRFAIQNYRSFKEQQVFSMSAGKHTRHKNHIYNANGKRLLKGSLIYGANASGKSNLIKAIQFGKRIALYGLEAVNLSNQHYRIDNSFLYKPGVFQYDFYYHNKFYSYGFAISYDKRVIESEWLYLIQEDKEKCIFERNKGKKVKTEMTFSSKDNEKRFKIYSEDVKDTKTLLSEIVNKKLMYEEFILFFDVAAWFSNLVFVFPQTRINNKEYYNSNETKSNLESLLKYFDTGIESIEGEKKKADEALSFLPPEIKSQILDDITKTLLKDNTKTSLVDFGIMGKRFRFSLKDGEIVSTRLMMNHGNKFDLFDLDDESDGTKRLFDLIPLYKKSNEPCVIFIDELDRSFHTKLTIEFLQKFFEDTIDLPSQMIVTLHDASVMNLNWLRQDEVWFVERNDDHASSIYSLNKFKERYDKDISKDYMLGRYGAIPCFNTISENEDE